MKDKSFLFAAGFFREFREIKEFREFNAFYR